MMMIAGREKVLNLRFCQTLNSYIKKKITKKTDRHWSPKMILNRQFEVTQSPFFLTLFPNLTPCKNGRSPTRNHAERNVAIGFGGSKVENCRYFRFTCAPVRSRSGTFEFQ